MDPRRRFDSARLVTFGTLVSLMFVILVVRLVRLQLVQSEIFLRQSETNRVRIVEKPPLRGLMFDRRNRLLVDNYPSYSLFAVPELIESSHSRDTLLTLTGLTGEEFDRRLHRIEGNRYTPVRIMRDLSFELLAALEERRVHIPGIVFRVETKRAYLHSIAPHALGHIGELTEDQADRYPDLKPGDMIGMAGLELQWNGELTGKKGYDYLEVDALGRIVGPLSGVESIPPKPGSDIILTIDLELQEKAEELLGDWAGAVVCIEPLTGEILAMASKPDFPSETFADVLTPERWKRLQEDPATPMLNRAVQGLYPPGSIFKMAVLIGGIETGAITTGWEIECGGGYQLGRRWFNCWNRGGHGEVGHRRSIEASCDVFYYMLGWRMGLDRFYSSCRKFGFGQPTGVDLPGDASGLLPDREFMDRYYGKERWGVGQMFNMSIGQGDVLVTPLQSAVYTATIANGGWWITPHLVKSIRTADGTERDPEYAVRRETGFSEETVRLVREDMLLVTEGRAGTATWLYDPRLHVAAKTGTSQNPHGDDHALYCAFAPFDDPQIAVVVIIEHGKHGTSTAGPIAHSLIRQHLELDDATWLRWRARVIARQEAALKIQMELEAEQSVVEQPDTLAVTVEPDTTGDVE